MWTRRKTSPPRPPSASGAIPLTCSDVDYWASEGPGDARYRLNLLGDQPTELVDVLRLGDPGDLGDLPSHVGGLADLRLDEDVRLYHAVLLGQCLSGIPLLPHA